MIRLDKPLNILNVVGARPNFVKIAPLMREYRKHPDRISATLLHTGQHYDDEMSGIFFSQLQIPEQSIYLGVGSGSHANQTARIMMAFEEALLNNLPDLVVVVGDVNSTLACTLVAVKLNIRVAHVEAGLRSFDRTMPEEINRIVTDSLADFLFTSSIDANANLLREGIPESKIFFVGNTMIDSLLAAKPALDASKIKQRLSINGQAFGYVTLHRPSNVDDRKTLSGICDALYEIQKHVALVWPLHPRTRKMLETHGLLELLKSYENLRLTDPLSYFDSLSLIASSALVLTDSGGVQEETTVFGVPCLTLRKTTERPITVLEGTNEVIGSESYFIVEKTLSLLARKRKKAGIPKYWDGKTAERIVNILLEKLSRNSPPAMART